MSRASLPSLVVLALVVVCGDGVSSRRSFADDGLPVPGPRPVVPGPRPVQPIPVDPSPAPLPLAPPMGVPPIPNGAGGSNGAGAIPQPRPAPSPAATPAPAPAPSPANDYRLSPGDEVTIEVILPSAVEAETGNLFRAPTKVVVSNGGEVDLPKSPGVRLDGRTRAEVRADIQRNLSAKGVSSQAEVLVNVTKFAARYIDVVGTVNKRLEVSPFTRTTILSVFAQCGDSMKDADMRVVQVNSHGRMRTIDVRAVLQSAGTSPEAYLEAGDTVITSERPSKPEVFVPSIDVGGFVRNPGAYRLFEPGQNQPLTLLRAITRAGGFADFAYLDEVVLRRLEGGAITQQVINLERVLKGKRGALTNDADTVLQAGDIIYVRGSN